jgi:hypothetical protein
MARGSTPDARLSPADRPSNVQVTVVPGPRGPSAVADRISFVRAGARSRMIVALAMAAVVAVVAVVSVGAIGTTSGGRAHRPLASQLGLTGAGRIAGATLGPDTSLYVTEIFHKVKGVWRPLRQATSSKCPAVQLRDIARSALVICERPTTVSPMQGIRNTP